MAFKISLPSFPNGLCYVAFFCLPFHVATHPRQRRMAAANLEVVLHSMAPEKLLNREKKLSGQEVIDGQIILLESMQRVLSRPFAYMPFFVDCSHAQIAAFHRFIEEGFVQMEALKHAYDIDSGFSWDQSAPIKALVDDFLCVNTQSILDAFHLFALFCIYSPPLFFFFFLDENKNVFYHPPQCPTNSLGVIYFLTRSITAFFAAIFSFCRLNDENERRMGIVSLFCLLKNCVIIEFYPGIFYTLQGPIFWTLQGLEFFFVLLGLHRRYGASKKFLSQWIKEGEALGQAIERKKKAIESTLDTLKKPPIGYPIHLVRQSLLPFLASKPLLDEFFNGAKHHEKKWDRQEKFLKINWGRCLKGLPLGWIEIGSPLLLFFAWGGYLFLSLTHCSP